MKVGKHTLLIDGNYFVFSRLFVLPKPKTGKLLGDDKQKRQFMRKLSIDFASEMRKLKGFVDDVVLTVDSKSWRKDLFPESNYKGTRKPSSSVEWSAVYEVYEAWQNILASKGVTVHQIQGAEADDVLFGWSTMLNNRGKSCLVWTGDRDLIQLVNYSKANDAHTIWYYNTKKSLYGYEGFIKDMEDSVAASMTGDDLLFNMSSDATAQDQAKENLTEWIRTNRVTTQEINCDDFIFTKIIQGDKSDNIRSVVTWTKTAASGKIMNYSITEKNANKILDKFKETEGDFTIDKFFNKDCVNLIVDIIHTTIGKSTPEEIRARFNQNLDLMLLHFNTIPDPIQKQIYKAIESDLTIMPIVQKLTKMEVILEGTDWLQKKGTAAPGGYNPFAGLKTPETNVQADSKITKELF